MLELSVNQRVSKSSLGHVVFALGDGMQPIALLPPPTAADR
jgi:hypothetical protein